MLHISSLTEAARNDLDFLVRTGTSAAARRARIVLLSVEGKSVQEIADKVGLHYQNVRKWLHRYREEGIQGLRHRSAGKGRNTKHSDETKRRIAEIAASDPHGLGLPFEEWSLPKLRSYLIERAIAPEMGIETIRQILATQGVEWRRNRRRSATARKVQGPPIGPGRIGIHFDRHGRVAFTDPTAPDSRAALELVSEHHQKGACDIQAVYDPEKHSITVRFFRRTRSKTGKEH